MKRFLLSILSICCVATLMATTLSGSIENTKLTWSFDTETATLTVDGDDYLCFGSTTESYFFDQFADDVRHLMIGQQVKRLDAVGAAELASRFKLNERLEGTNNLQGEMQVFAYSLPLTHMDYLETIEVEASNATLASSYDGLYSKDLKTLLFYPMSACRYEEGEDIVVDDFSDELTTISTGAFREVFGLENDAVMKEVKLWLPETVTKLEKSAVYLLNENIDRLTIYIEPELPPMIEEGAFVLSGLTVAVGYEYYSVWMNALADVNVPVVVYEEYYAMEHEVDMVNVCGNFELEDGFRGEILCDLKFGKGDDAIIGARITGIPYDEEVVYIPEKVPYVQETWENVYNEEYDIWEDVLVEKTVYVEVIRVSIYSDVMKEIHIPATVQTISSLEGTNLQNIYVASDNANYSSEDGLLLSKNKSTLLKYPTGKRETTYTMPSCVKRFGEMAVYNNPYLKELNLANVEAMVYGAIEHCTSLETIYVGSSMQDVAEDNFDAPNLLNIYVDGKNKKYQSIDGVLVENNSVLLKYPAGRTATTYVVPEGLTEIGENAIERNEYLTEVVLPSTLKRLHIEAIYLENLSKITLPESLEQLDVAAIGSNVLKSIHIPANVKIIGVGPFMDCVAVENITVADNNPYYTAVDGVLYTKSMNCLVQYPNAKKNTTFTVPNKVKSLSLWSFLEVPALKELVLQEGLVLVEECLNELDNLERIVCNTVTPPYVDEENEYMLRGFWEEVILCIPREAHDAYLNHPVWGNFVHVEYITADGAEMEKKEVEIVEDETSVEITWPKVEGADNYTIVITYQGMPICTLTFNALGQLVNINFERHGAPRAATEGFKFTVTGLDSGTQYAYSVVATAQGEEVKSYTGEFTTLGEATGVVEGVESTPVTVVDGLIVSERGDVTIYTVTGNDVTAHNGNLSAGVYLVRVGTDVQKVMIR